MLTLWLLRNGCHNFKLNQNLDNNKHVSLSIHSRHTVINSVLVETENEIEMFIFLHFWRPNVTRMQTLWTVKTSIVGNNVYSANVPNPDALVFLVTAEVCNRCHNLISTTISDIVSTPLRGWCNQILDGYRQTAVVSADLQTTVWLSVVAASNFIHIAI